MKAPEPISSVCAELHHHRSVGRGGDGGRGEEHDGQLADGDVAISGAMHQPATSS
ncbi:hypothetical protein [Rhodococcus erythropolis]|uniref:hypothetical protein n=1 Tax=Rhodococcus erythropolis TaxID=1833 RepID=UPI001C4035CA